MNTGLNTLHPYPFEKLGQVFEGLSPSDQPLIPLTIGEPQHAPPALALQPLKEKLNDYGRYPPIGGTPDWKAAVRSWLHQEIGLIQPHLIANLKR